MALKKSSFLQLFFSTEVDSELLPITVQTRSGRRAGAFAALQFC